NVLSQHLDCTLATGGKAPRAASKWPVSVRVQRPQRDGQPSQPTSGRRNDHNRLCISAAPPPPPVVPTCNSDAVFRASKRADAGDSVPRRPGQRKGDYTLHLVVVNEDFNQI